MSAKKLTYASPAAVFSEVLDCNVRVETSARPGLEPVQEVRRPLLENRIRHSEFLPYSIANERCKML